LITLSQAIEQVGDDVLQFANAIRSSQNPISVTGSETVFGVVTYVIQEVKRRMHNQRIERGAR
jgi:hypothetical protein